MRGNTTGKWRKWRKKRIKSTVYLQAESEASLWDCYKRFSVKYRKLCITGALCLLLFHLQTGRMSNPLTDDLSYNSLPPLIPPPPH
jgi:hypothetical protein